MLDSQCPVYVWKRKELKLAMDRQNKKYMEGLRFKAGATAVITRLNNELNEAYEAQDLSRCFHLAFRSLRYITSHCKAFFSWKERKVLEDGIYNRVGNLYLDMKWLDPDDSELESDKQEEKIHCMLGTEMPDNMFIRKIKKSLWPHVLDKT